MKRILKYIAEKILFGLLFGIGITIPLYFSFVASLERSEEALKRKDNSEGMEILWHEDISDEEGLKFRGELLNNSNSTWFDISMEVEFFRDSSFVYESHGNVHTNVDPNQKENFVLECKKYKPCEDDDVAKIDYDFYTIRIYRVY